MKALKNLIALALVSTASVGLLVACTEDEEPPSCLLDSECGENEVCEAELCVATCASDEDCAADEVCGARMNGEGTVCQAAPDETSCADEADPNAYCEGELGAGAICDDAGECVLPAAEVYAVQITDVTTATDACEGVNDPGSDIQGVELLDAGGNSLGWGALIGDGVITEGNDEANYTVIDGTAPTLDGDGCVDTFSGNVLSLGCGGSIGVEFRDDAGTPIPLETGQTIAVYEYGGACSTGTTEDEWTVASCSDLEQVKSDIFDSCSNVLGETGSGVGTVGVTL